MKINKFLLAFSFLVIIFFFWTKSENQALAYHRPGTLFCAACSVPCGGGFRDCLQSNGNVYQEGCNNQACTSCVPTSFNLNCGQCSASCGPGTKDCQDNCGNPTSIYCNNGACAPTPTPNPGLSSSQCNSIGGNCAARSQCVGTIYGNCANGLICCQTSTPESSCQTQGGTCKSSCSSSESVVGNCSAGNVCCKTQGRTLETCNSQGSGWNPSGTCTAITNCSTPPSPTPKPDCNANPQCPGPCSVACGSGFKPCSYTTHNGSTDCNQVAAPSRSCFPTCQNGQACVGHVCVDTYSISGNLYVDANVDTYKNNGEVNYTGSATLQLSTGAVANAVGGVYTFGNLLPGSYVVSYTNPPTGAGGYSMTYPLNGPPPSLTVTVGGSCSTNGAHDAACSNGNIVNLDFGITNNKPWIQGVGSDMRIDSGFINKIPASAVGGPYASLNGAGTTPGLIFTGGTTPDFGQGQASAKNWIVGGPQNSETYTPTKVGGTVKTSYSYVYGKANQANITPTDISSFCSGGISNCTLSAVIPHGVYAANGNLTLNAFNFPNGQNYVILIKGNLTVKGRITIPNGSTALFSASGNINIDPSVGESTPSSTTSDIEGIYSADQSFIAQGNNSCSIGPDKRLNIAGSIITNAGGTGGSFQYQRDLCANDPYYPTVYFIERPDFIINSPSFLNQPNFTYQEIAP